MPFTTLLSPPVAFASVAPLWCDLECCSQTVVVLSCGEPRLQEKIRAIAERTSCLIDYRPGLRIHAAIFMPPHARRHFYATACTPPHSRRSHAAAFVPSLSRRSIGAVALTMPYLCRRIHASACTPPFFMPPHARRRIHAALTPQHWCRRSHAAALVPPL